MTDTKRSASVSSVAKVGTHDLKVRSRTVGRQTCVEGDGGLRGEGGRTLCGWVGCLAGGGSHGRLQRQRKEFGIRGRFLLGVVTDASEAQTVFSLILFVITENAGST